jgi:hypothetical protein
MATDDPNAAVQPAADFAQLSEEAWRGVFKEQAESGLTHSEFCRSRSIPSHVYFWRRRKFVLSTTVKPKAKKLSVGEGAPKGSLVRVQVGSTSPPGVRNASATLFELALANGRTLRFPQAVDPQSLLRVLSLVEGRCSP